MAQLAVDPLRCKGRGICALIAPRQIDLDEWGFPMVSSDESEDPATLRRARRAVAACPERALRLVLRSSTRPGEA